MKTKTPNDLVIVICTTPYSTRLPKKCFRNIAGKMVLEHILSRIEPLDVPTIIAIPEIPHTSKDYLMYKRLAVKYDCSLYEGHTLSPLHRTAASILENYKKPPKYTVRITHDDILIDPESIVDLYNTVRKGRATYGCMPAILDGAGVEVILTETIIKQAKAILHSVEHLSYFVKGNRPITVKPRPSVMRPYRMTLDYPEDAVVIESVLRVVGCDADTEDVCKFLDENRIVLKYNEMPDITVYTCMKDAEPWITDCITSVMVSGKSSGLKFEYIIIDDGSRDMSLIKALSQIGLWDDQRVRIIVNDENKGLATSSNIVLNQARGKYIMRVDADDMIIPQAIRTLHRKIVDTDAVVVYPAYYEGNTEVSTELVFSPTVHHHAGCAMMNKKTINELKFKEGIRHWDSRELYERIRLHPELKIEYVKEPMFLYRKHKGSLSADTGSVRADTLDDIIKKYGVKE